MERWFAPFIVLFLMNGCLRPVWTEVPPRTTSSVVRNGPTPETAPQPAPTLSQHPRDAVVFDGWYDPECEWTGRHPAIRLVHDQLVLATEPFHWSCGFVLRVAP